MDEAVLYKIFEQATTAIIVYQEQGGIRYANPGAVSILHANRNLLETQALEHFFPASSNQGLFSQLTSHHRSFVYRNATLQPQGSLPIMVDLSVHTISRSSQGRRISQFNIYPLSRPTLPPSQAEVGTGTPMDTAALLKVLRNQTDMPLHALDELVNRLLEMQPRSDQLPFLHGMRQSGKQLRNSLHDILLYTDLVYGKYKPEAKSPFQPGPLLEKLKKKYKTWADETGNLITIDMANGGENYYMANEEALTLMLSKLMDNALRFTRNSQIKLLLREDDRKTGEPLLTLGVEDKGTGMSADKLGQATQPFISWKSPWEQQNHHSGLGLSIVQLLAGAYGGRLSLQSHPGNTAVTITLPCKQYPDKPQAILTKEGPEQKNLKGLRLLYVEDLMPNHFLMEGLCAIWQISLDTAYNGKEALSKFYKNPYDVVLMDLNMPLMNGYDTSLQIRQSSDASRKAVPIIAVTGSASLVKKQHIQEYGINDILTKPIKPDELYQKLTSLSGR